MSEQRLGRILAVFLVIGGLAIAGLPGCGGGGSGNNASGITWDKDATALARTTLTVGNATLSVAIASTVTERRRAPQESTFSDADGAADGVLYVYPASSTVLFQHERLAVPTTAVMLDESGAVLATAPIYPTPTSPDAAEDEISRLMGLYAQSNNAVDEGLMAIIRAQASQQAVKQSSIAWAFPVAASRVTYILQAGTKSLAGLSPGDVVNIPAIAQKRVAQAEPDGTVVTIRGGSRPQSVRLHVAATPAARDALLTAAMLDALDDDTAYVLLYPLGAGPRSIQIRDCRKTLDVFYGQRPTVDGGDYRGSLVGLQPLRPAAGERARPGEISREVEFRAWEYRHPRAYDTLVLFKGGLLRRLRVRDADFANLSIPCPKSVLDRAITPEPDAWRFAVGPSDGAAHDVTLGILDTDDARKHALRAHAPLPRASDDEDGDSEDFSDASAAWSPDVDPAAAPVDGWLLRYDRERDRPLQGGGLPAPYDLGVLDSEGALVRVYAVDEALPTDASRFAGVKFATAWIMPRGWFFQAGLAPESTVAGAVAIGLKNPLEFSTSVSRQHPEPERFRITVGGQAVDVELSVTESERTRGLQFRRSLAPTAGMLFVYPDEKSHSFWMPNCYFDQTIAYVHADWTIRRLADMLAPYQPGVNQETVKLGHDSEVRRPRNVGDDIRAAQSGEWPPGVVPAVERFEQAGGLWSAKFAGRLDTLVAGQEVTFSSQKLTVVSVEERRVVLEHKTDGRVFVRTLGHDSGGPVQFALEVNVGWYAAHGVREGDAIEPGPVVREFVRRVENGD